MFALYILYYNVFKENGGIHMNKTNVGKSVFNKVGKMRLTAILLGLIVLMATALDIYADFVVTSTYAGTGNKTTASQMGISFSSEPSALGMEFRSPQV